MNGLLSMGKYMRPAICRKHLVRHSVLKVTRSKSHLAITQNVDHSNQNSWIFTDQDSEWANMLEHFPIFLNFECHNIIEYHRIS